MASGKENEGEGKVEQVEGAVKEGWGALTGDRSTEAEGKIDRTKGSVQEEYGKVKSNLTGENDPTRKP